MFSKTWINENNIVQELPSKHDMQRKPMQIWFWALTNTYIMYLKSDWTHFQLMFQYSLHGETRKLVFTS